MPNISRDKDNQTMKSGQLIECNMRNIILDKSYTKCGGQTTSRPFNEKLKFEKHAQNVVDKLVPDPSLKD